MEQEPQKKKKEWEPGTGIAIGVALGSGIGVALDNIAIGVAIGVALGAAMDGRFAHKKPLPPEKRKYLFVALLAAAVVFVAALGFYFFTT